MALLLASAYTATAAALPSFSPWAIGAWSGLLAAALMLVPRIASRRILTGEVDDLASLGRLAILGVLGGCLFHATVNVAVAEAGATIAAFVAGLSSVIAAILAPVFLREKIGPQVLAAFGVAMVGALILTEPWVSPHLLNGVLVGLGAAIAWALFLLLAKRWGRSDRYSAGDVALSNAIAMGVGLLVFQLALDPSAVVPSSPTPGAVAAILWLAIMPAIVAKTLLVRSLALISLRQSASILLLKPVFAWLIALVVLGQGLTSWQMAGAGLLLVGLWLGMEAAPKRAAEEGVAV